MIQPLQTTLLNILSLLRPRKKIMCHDHLELVLNTFRLEIIHRIVVRNRITYEWEEVLVAPPPTSMSYISK